MSEIRPEELEELHELLGKLDEKKRTKYLDSLRKSAEGGSEDVFEQLKAVKAQRKELKDERDKLYEVVAYWIGSPLRTLKSLTDMAVQSAEGMDASEMREFVKHIGAQTEKFQLQMRNVVWWSSFQVRNVRYEPKPVELEKLVEAVVAPLRESAEKKGIDLVLKGHEGVEVFADASVLEIALSNMFSNAVKFSKRHQSVKLNVRIEGDEVYVQICDEGIGMSEAKLANVFNPARRATQKGTAGEEGYGYGMPVIKAALELHERPLEVTSIPNAGTCLTFWLPKA